MSNPEVATVSTEYLRDEALCRSVLYGALSIGLHYPDGKNICFLQSEDARLALEEAASLLMLSLPPEPAGSEATAAAEHPVDLVARVEEWVRTFDSLTPEQWLSAHGRLFGHTARGSVCPYEAEYGQEGLFEQPRQLAKIMGFYQAFGLTPRTDERERADHASCELEFMDFLCRKEAFALESEDQAAANETRKAIRLFVRDHLGRFGRAFARLLQEQDPDGFFGKLGALLLDFITFESRRLGIQRGAIVIPLRSAEEDSVPMACGSQSELIQVQVPR